MIIFLLDGKSGLQKEDFELITLIRKENKRMVTVINKIDYKYFDENFFMYLENDDLCKRLIDCGENIYAVPNSKIKQFINSKRQHLRFPINKESVLSALFSPAEKNPNPDSEVSLFTFIFTLNFFLFFDSETNDPISGKNVACPFLLNLLL